MNRAISRLADAIASAPVNSSPPVSAPAMTLRSASFVAADGADANLSQVTIAGQSFTKVPRLGHAGDSWPPAAGTSLAVLQVGHSLLILGIQLGNTVL